MTKIKNRRFTMSFLKKLFPNVFRLEKGNVKPFVISIVIYSILILFFGAAVGAVFGWVPGLAGKIIGIVLSVITFFVFVYSVAGIVLAILKYCEVIKNPVDDGKTSKADEVADKIGGIFDKVVNATTNVVDKVTERKPAEETEEKKDEE